MKRLIAVSAAALMAATAVAMAQGSPGGGGGGGAGGGGAASPGASGGGTGPSQVQGTPPAGVTPGPGGTPPPGSGVPEKMQRDEVGTTRPRAEEKNATDRAAKGVKESNENRKAPSSSGGSASDSKGEKGAKGASAGNGKDGPSGGSAAAPEEKKPQIRSAFQKHRVRPAQNINVSINVGVAIPRSVTLYTVPADVVTIYPAYKRYKYFLIDDRICIVDPGTLKIVDVIVLSA